MRKLTALFLWLVIIAGAGLGGFNLQNNRSKGFQLVEGRVVETSLGEATDSQDSHLLRPSVRFEYEIEGNQYASGSLGLWQPEDWDPLSWDSTQARLVALFWGSQGTETGTQDRGAAEKLIADHLEGAFVSGWYPSNKPEAAVIFPARRPVALPMIVAAIALLLWWTYFTSTMMLVRHSLRQHALSSSVTAFSLALGCGLVIAVFSLKEQTHEAFTGGEIGYDGVLGARGSPLQLVLNTVFHLETSPGNIPWEMYTALRDNRRQVELAIPYAVGDNYQGYRIVGTTPEIFTRFEYRKGRRFELFDGGRPFDPSRKEAVIGSTVAQKTGLRVGSTFKPYHGIDTTDKEEHEDLYLVTGVSRPTNSPSDQVIWIPIEGIFRMEGHQLTGTGEVYIPSETEEIADEHKQVSAVMVKFRSPNDGYFMSQAINRQGNEATLAWPIGQVMADFFNKMGWIQKILELIAYLVVIVAAFSILASLYNTMNERRREFAILRSLGARRRTVFGVIVVEAGSIAFVGALLGTVVYVGILAGAAYLIRRETGVVLDLTAYHPALWVAPLGMVALGAASGVIPAMRAYRTDVASNLVPAS